MPTTVTQFKNKHDPSDELIALRAENTDLNHRLNTRKQTSGQISEAMAAVLESVKVFSPVALKHIKPRTKPKVESPVVHVVHITDWHIGQVTNAADIENFGAFDYDHARASVERLAENVIRQTEVARTGSVCDTCHVIGTGDWVSGDIHHELEVTNEFPAPVQAVRAGYLIGQFLATLAGHFNTVQADLITAGNHDRITKKPQAEEGGINSWGYVACEIAKQHVAQCARIALTVHTALSEIIQVGGLQYLITHGDGIKSDLGIPFYGFERRKMREAMARMNMPTARHFNKIIMGHIHQAVNHPDWATGGSLSGTGAFDHKCGRHAKPHQTTWFIHPRHGEYGWCRQWV